MSVSFEMFLIDRGICDAYEIGQWQQYVSHSSEAEFAEAVKIHQRHVKGLQGIYNSATLARSLLAHFHPDEWLAWKAYRRLLGESL